MREIKFRYWDKNDPNDNNIWWYFEVGKPYPIKPENMFNINQFTGLKDKNGVEIYEGDIVRTKKMNGEVFVGKVLISPTQGVVVGNWPIGFEKESEIIGNIHESPDLLQQPADGGSDG